MLLNLKAPERVCTRAPRRESVVGRKPAASGAKIALSVVLTLSLTQPVRAGSSVSTGANSAPTVPSAYVTNTQNLASTGSGGCQSEYNTALNGAADTQQVFQGISLGLASASTALKISADAMNLAAAGDKVATDAAGSAGLFEAAIGVVTPLDAAPAAPGLAAAAAALVGTTTADALKITAYSQKEAAYAIDIAKIASDTSAYGSSVYANVLRNYVQGTGAFAGANGLAHGLPQCNTTF